MTLIELLVAMLVMAFGVMALVAAFTSGILALERGAKTSTAGALADKQMETYRQGTFASIPIGAQTPVTTSGSNGGSYWLQATISWTCPYGTLVAGPPPACSTASRAPTRPVKLVSIDVRDTSSTGKLLVNETSTFDSSTG
jgi:type II secretory pathway pseudopilin PulG